MPETEAATADPEAGAPEDSIVVTEEMIAAGVDALADFNPDYATEEGAVERIYCAMELASPRAQAALARA